MNRMTHLITITPDLDRFLEQLEEQPKTDTVYELFSFLRSRRLEEDRDTWHGHVREVREHPILKRVHEDPLSERCFSKPRGYAGDAKLIDFLYSTASISGMGERVSPLGRTVNEALYNAPEAFAVRARRRILAERIDEIVARGMQGGVNVLSLACGHLRESETCGSLKNGCIDNLYAIDHDPKTIEVVEKCTAGTQVRPILGTVKDVFKGTLEFESCDFAYASGLYDYLNDDVASRLTRKLFDLTKPGGTVLVANFLPGNTCIGYMEACLDWWLLYRTEEEVWRFMRDIPETDVANARTFIEENDSIVFLEITKR